jgi:exodeoxyribonuclease-3
MKIATWNVNSILARLPHVTRWLEAEQPDVLCVQETKCIDDKFPSLELKAVGYDCTIFGQQSYNGVTIISKAGCAAVQRGYPNDDPTSQARLVTADIGKIPIQTRVDEAAARFPRSKLRSVNASSALWRL